MLRPRVIPFANEVGPRMAAAKVIVLRAAHLLDCFDHVIQPVSIHGEGKDLFKAGGNLRLREKSHDLSLPVAHQVFDLGDNPFILQRLHPEGRAVSDDIHRIIAGIILHIPADAQIRPDQMGEAVHDQFNEQIALDRGDHVPVVEVGRHDSRKMKLLRAAVQNRGGKEQIRGDIFGVFVRRHRAVGSL